jgi:hypothetical protein
LPAAIEATTVQFHLWWATHLRKRILSNERELFGHFTSFSVPGLSIFPRHTELTRKDHQLLDTTRCIGRCVPGGQLAEQSVRASAVVSYLHELGKQSTLDAMEQRRSQEKKINHIERSLQTV